MSIESTRSTRTKSFQAGDRVRVTRPNSAYTGCRGTVADIPGAGESEAIPLGYYIAIDGENGLSRPFLRQELEGLAAVKVRRRATHDAGARKVND